MAGTPELIIPVRLSTDKAAAALKSLGAAGAASGGQVAGGMKAAESAVGGLDTSVANLIKSQMGLAAIKASAAAMGSEFKRAADYVQTLAQQFSALRTTMQQVAKLTGKENTSTFTTEQVHQGMVAGQMPAEWVAAQESFQSYAGAQIEGPNAKLSAADAVRYQQGVAKYMKASKMPAALGMRLAGSLLTHSKGPQNVEDLLDKFGRSMLVLEKAETPPEQLISPLSQAMAYDISASEAAQMLAVVAPASPGAEETALEGAFRAIDEMKKEGSGEEFGVKRGMSYMESGKAFGEEINRRKQAMIAGGKTELEAEDELVAMLAEKKIAPDLRERRGLVRGFGKMGIEKGGFKTFKRYAEETPADYLAKTNEAYDASEEGKANQRRVNQASAEARVGQRYQSVLADLEEAKTIATNEGRLEQASAGNVIRDKVLGTMTGVSFEQQIINEIAIDMKRRKAANMGITESLSEEHGDVKFRSQESVNAELLGINRRMLRVMEERKAAADLAAKPRLSAPPPQFWDARM